MNRLIILQSKFLVILGSALLITSCATLDPNYEEPVVTLASFKALPSEGMTPTFEIGLRIMNPNSSALELEGIVYTVSILDRDLLKGVGKDFPVIEGYSEEVVMLTGSANLLNGVRMFADLARTPAETIDYEFEAKLDLGGIYPSIRVKESGSFSLNGQTQ